MQMISFMEDNAMNCITPMFFHIFEKCFESNSKESSYDANYNFDIDAENIETRSSQTKNNHLSILYL